MHTTYKSFRNSAYILLALILLMTACAPAAEGTPTVQTETPLETPAATTEIPPTLTEVTTAPTEMPEPVPGYDLPDFTTPENTCEPDYSPITSTIDLEDNGLVYVPDQIILTGYVQDIESYISENPGIISGGPLDDFEPLPTDDGDIYVRLYSIGSGQSVWEVMGEINDYASGKNIFVFAEPNYLVGLGPGHGGGVNGAPDGDPDEIKGNAKEGFLSQWAFTGDSSIHLFDDNLPHQWTPNAITGANVDVVVFDTTPLISGSHTIDWAVQPFNLCVWQPGLMFGNSGAPSTRAPDQSISLGEHGLFVTGLAHRVAPAAQYTLIEVLNSEAYGDVHTLLYAMRKYARSRDDDLTNTVMNLSLGLEIDRHPDLIEDNEAIRNSIGKLKGNREIYLQYLQNENFQAPYYLSLDYLAGQFAQDFPVVALGVSLAIYQEQGAVVVAAAGNEKGNPPNAPARFDEVIGVAASNFDRVDSCFTNRGDLAAPGGDAEDPAMCSLNTGTPTPCPADQMGCEYTYTLISLVSQNASVSGYATWQGTSFAAPQVSGLAALLLQQRTGLPASQVRTVIECGRPQLTTNRLGSGIIDVENTIHNCP